MQLRHRRRHWRTWLVLGPLMLVFALIGLAARRPVPVQSNEASAMFIAVQAEGVRP